MQKAIPILATTLPSRDPVASFDASPVAIEVRTKCLVKCGFTLAIFRSEFTDRLRRTRSLVAAREMVWTAMYDTLRPDQDRPLLSPAEIAESTGVDRSTVVYAIKRCRERGAKSNG